MTLSELNEMIEIINGREKAARMNIDDGSNDLCSAYNEGVAMMAKYMRDYFKREYDKAHETLNENGGAW